jgi:hypothetical protein
MSDFDPRIHRLGMMLKFVYALVGLLVGAGCIIAGVILGLGGVVGHTSWTASALGFTTNMTDATPGVIVFVVGIFFVLITRFNVKHIVKHPDGTSTTRYNRESDARRAEMEARRAEPEASSKLPEPKPEETPQTHAGSTASSYSSGGQSSLTYTTLTKI